MADIIVVTTDFVPGYEVEKVLGVVMGSTVRARHIGRDIKAALKNIVGGEIKDYTELLEDARREAMNRMIKQAKELGADAVINLRFMTSMVTTGAAEILAYGTAVKLKKREL
ncbi:MAG: YbjQ family protein [Candidatus Nezhaarchaeales archaeon]|nr:MAG: YbjQ family protein [Thermoprotei archaeon]